MLFCKFSKETVFLYFQFCKDDDVQLLVFPQALTRVIWGAHETVVVIWGVIWDLIWQGGEQVIWGDHQPIVQLPAQFRLALGFSISCILLQIWPANSFLLTHSFAAHFYTQITCHSFTLEVPPGRFPISYEAFNCFPPDQTLFFQLTPLRDFQREQEKEKEFRIKWEVKSSRPAWKSARTLADW